MGDNRGNGANLGAWYVQANNGWSNANGNNWSARQAFGRRAASYLGWAIHAHDRDLYHTLKRRLAHARH